MENNGVSIGFVGILQIVFIVLKLCNVIDWSWFWVLSPIWIRVILIFIFGLIVLALEVIEKRGS